MSKDKLTSWQKYQSTEPSNIKALIDLTAAIAAEEHETVVQYRHIASRLETSGFAEQARAIRRVADQEHTHATIFNSIAKDIYEAQKQ